MLRYVLPVILLAVFANTAFAGTGYQVTATDGDETVTYEVNFGGGMFFDQYTAFDPATKKFVYLSWKSRPMGDQKPEDPPKPVCSIWNHETGKTVDLYKFPDAKHPLPVIPSIKEMKVCPMTGDKDFTARPFIAYD